MRPQLVIPSIVALLISTAAVQAEEMPDMPQPVAQHAWLQQLVGQWESKVQMFENGEPSDESQGTETVRPVGDFWIMAENRGDFMGQPFTGIQTLGFDPEKQQFVGTWVDSVTGYLWTYEGTLDEAEKALTLRTEGPCPLTPGDTVQFKEVLEVESDDHKTFTSSMQDEDGNWITVMKADYQRL